MFSFIRANVATLTYMCVAKAQERIADGTVRPDIVLQVQSLLEHLADTLEAIRHEASASSVTALYSQGRNHESGDLESPAITHGRELAALGSSVNEVMAQYSDLLESIVELALSQPKPLTLYELLSLNYVVNGAIASAVQEFHCCSAAQVASPHTAERNEKAAFLMHELRNALATATLAADAIEAGNLLPTGRTWTVLKRSHAAMQRLIEDSPVQAQVKKRTPHLPTVFSLAEFIRDAEDVAQLDARSRRCDLKVMPVGPHLCISGDRDLLLAALGNLLHNAFKFSSPGTEVSVTAHTCGDRLFIDVADQCGGILESDVESLFIPFRQYGKDRSGLGVGLSIARRGIVANGGTLTVTNKPGIGCIFRIDVPSFGA